MRHTHMELPFGGTVRLRHVRDRHARGCLGRHDDDHRLRRPAAGHARAGRTRGVARQGCRRMPHRLRLPPDHRRRRRRLAQGDGRARRRGHHQLQAVHGLPGRLLQRRRPDPAGDADGRLERLHDHDARRERHRDRRAGAAGAGGGPHRPDLPRRSPGPGRPRRRPPTARSCWPGSPAHRCTSCTCRPSRRSPSCRPTRTRAGTSSARPARSTSTCRWRSSWARRASRAPSGSARRPCVPRPSTIRTSCGATCAPTTCRS